MNVLPSNRPVYIEEFWQEGDFDWHPAFCRAVSAHVLEAGPYQLPILLGDTTARYALNQKLDLFGVRLEGLYPGVELYFPCGTDGVHIHSAGTSLDVCPPELAGKGSDCTLRNVNVVGVKAEGTRGVIVQRTSVLDRVNVSGWGWHGVHITADTNRTSESIDGGNSNANRTHLDRCGASYCGSKPGADPRLVTEGNPTGRREWGCGLRIQGGDTNICTTQGFHAVGCSGWAIDDGGFLGNHHLMPDENLCGHVVEDWESAADVYGVPVGSRVNLAYRLSNANARGVLELPYVETAVPMPIVDVRPPSFVISGIGGADQPSTKRIKAGEWTGGWRASTTDNTGSVTLAEGKGALVSVSSPTDGPIRLKYAGGFWRMDHRNVASRVYFNLTGDASFEGTRQLTPGRMALGAHYRNGDGLFREQLYGKATTLVAIESAYPAASKQRGDTYTCLAPVVGEVHTAVVVDEAGVKRWATVGVVQ